MVVGFALASVSVVPMRLEPNHRAEQVSQLLFGERVIVLTKGKQDWFYVRCEWDKYEGWVKGGQITFITDKQYKRKLSSFSISDQDKIVQPDGYFSLSPGSSLFLLKGKKLEWNTHFTYKGKRLLLKNAQFEPNQFTEYCKSFIGSPYLWGGRNKMGIDCSGFSQVLFKLCNYRLPRDASQQAKMGEAVDFLQEAQCGDLAFFDNEEGNINHVGILLNSTTIIHATDTTGCVIIDSIDNNGIISRKKRMRTHNLRLVKRYF